MADFFEIVELPTGEIGLRRADDASAEMIVKIQFSPEAKEGLKGHYVEIAHAMIEAGINKVSEISGFDIEHEDILTEPETPSIVH